MIFYLPKNMERKTIIVLDCSIFLCITELTYSTLLEIALLFNGTENHLNHRHYEMHFKSSK